MIDDLSCENCPQYHKKRCKEQQEKKNNIIKNILADIVDKAKICGCDIKEKTEILFQQIPDVTRCDVVLENQLKRLEQQYEKLQKENEILQQYRGSKQASYEAMQKLWNEAEYDRKKYKKCLDEIKSEIENKDECLDITIHQISKIINEVENER